MLKQVNASEERNGLLPTPPLPADLPPVSLTDNARQVLVRRYVRRGKDGQPVETVEEMFWRVAYHVAACEAAWGEQVLPRARQFYELLTSKRFFPNSPTFTGAGTPLGQLAACFVLPISDDMGRDPAGIFQTLRDAALIQQTGGGNGFSFSRLRPKGALVKSSAGQATGPVGFLRVYDKAFGEIAQGGTRRGANMAVLRVDHPDIEEFVTCKTDENAITNFNISVGITDAFMEAVRNNADWDLRFPDLDAEAYRGFNGTLEQAEAAGIPIKVYKTVRARELFDKIVRQAHHNGEPGVLFLDTANRSNPVPHLYQLEATNPCFVGQTRIPTEFGLLTIAELAQAGLDGYIAADNRAQAQGMPNAQPGVALRPASPAWLTRRDAPVFTITTRMGYQVTATADHRFLTPNGYVPLEHLRPGDTLLLQSGEGPWSRETRLPNFEAVAEKMAAMALSGDRATDHLVQRADFQQLYANLPTRWSHELGLVLGWLVGDGWLSETSNSPVGMVFSSPEMFEMIHQPLAEWFGPGHVHVRGELLQLTYGRLPYEFFRSLGVQPVRAPEKRLPEAIWIAPRPAVVGFLQGLFSADGTVQVNRRKGDCTIRLASSSKGLLQDVQILLSNFGILSHVYHRRPAGRKAMPDGKGDQAEYAYRPQYELVIGKANRDRFAELIGFADVEKQARLQAFISAKKRRSNTERFTDVVKHIRPAGRADVYDLSQPQTNSLIANGFVAHNCGEQFLGPYENCCLGSVNLAQHFGPNGAVDWEKLRQSVELSTIFLDDVVEANAYVPAVPQLAQAALRARRIGLGIMGLADLMYHAGVRYGSPEGQEFASQVMEFIRYHCMKTSIALAEKRGPFPAIQGSLYDPQNLRWQPPRPLLPYTRDWGRPAVDWGSILDGIRRHGIRNAAQTTIAPTGTIATVAGCEGYGCEPVFALAYIRHVNDNGKDLKLTYASPAFEKALLEAGIDPQTRQTIVDHVMEKGTCQGLEEVPQAIRQVFVVSQDITAEEHVRLQAALQAFVDNSLSKTVNFPESATEADVATAYQLAWELGCKGITVYVTGSRQKVVLETKATARQKGEIVEPAPALPSEPKQLTIWHDKKKPRPRRLRGHTISVETPLGKAFVTVNENGGGQPFEVFVNTSKAGSDTAAVSEAIGRLISYILRLASPVAPRERLKEVWRQLSGIGGGRSLGFGPNRVRSLPDGVAQALAEYLENSNAQEDDEAQDGDEDAAADGNGFNMLQESARLSDAEADAGWASQTHKIGDLCPECGQASVVNEEGCRKCYACGYSEC
jgi:ribonucleoside-diphosphate reductase alpha chain